MNYITMNETSSQEINGLLIQSLPPISKPQMRTQIETIDGRDGDVVTRLGYSSYDKEFTVGLYGKFDIDDVIAFFNTSGTVVFSNEPDKYYKYQILEQIDFERLIRFKTATVRMHCQPFKYSAVEKPLTFTVSANDPVPVINRGNVTSKPKITIYGSGSINVYINNNQALTINLGNEEYITIDVDTMNAEKDGVLKNRLVDGDYENMIFQVGKNTVSMTGTVTQVVVENYSRWL